MTKEEAKKSLQNTKVYVAGKSAQIQEKLFELGFNWKDGSIEVQLTSSPFLYICSEGIQSGCDMHIFREDQNEEVTADYILGLTWEEDKPQYQFKPFDRVLVRDFDEEDWHVAFYSHQDDDGRFVINVGWHRNQCIPYEGNEELVGTTNKPK